jgi:thiol:disulfide interchange protein DsbD
LKPYLLLLRTFLFVCWIFPFAVTAAPLTNQTDSGRHAFLAQADEDNILPPDEAFKLSVTAKDAQTLDADFKIAPGHYLYRDRIKFEIKPPGSSISAVELPKGDLKQDPNFGQTEVFHQNFNAIINLAFAGSAPNKITLLATYQGCSEKGLCYSPIHKTLEVDLPAAGAGLATPKSLALSADSTDDSQAASLLKSGKLWLIIAGFFGFGLLLSLTPCMLPMIPILSGIIVGSKKSGRLHTFNLSLAYTMGMALSYTLAGIAAGLSGQLLSNALQNPWALGSGAFVFVLLALSMFGFYELQLPSSFESRMVNATNHIKGGRFLGVFAMGALSALIVSPCVAAPLAGALLYISKTHDVVLGGTALFALSLGMGVPLLLIGSSVGTLLPKAGPWMTAVNNFFGVVMLGMAIWLISPLIPTGVGMALWAALLIVPAIYMHALDGLPAHASQWMKFWKGVAVIALLLGVALLIGAISGAKSPLQPLAGLTASANSETRITLPFHRVKNLADLESNIKASSGKLVMLDFYADWCVACKEFEQFTFSDPRVRKSLANVVLLQADVTQNSSDDSALLKRFGLFGPPGIIFFDHAGQEVTQLKVIGYQDADKFLTSLNKLNLAN